MNRTTTARPVACRTARTQRSAAARAAALAAVVFLSACSNSGSGQPSWTAEPDASGTSASQPPSSPSGSPTNGTETPASPESAASSGAATAAAWKTYTDPARKVKFDLPNDWIAQAVAADAGMLPGALKVEVKSMDGTLMATLKTGLPEAAAAECPGPQRKPYVVLSSEPVDLPSSESAAIEPRVVFRVIQGYRYFGSYGITNIPGGADGTACSLVNLVGAPAGTGNYSFGDMDALKAYTPEEKVAPAKAFDTLDQAEKYVRQGSEFANVERMLMSLVINT